MATIRPVFDRKSNAIYIIIPIKILAIISSNEGLLFKAYTDIPIIVLEKKILINDLRGKFHAKYCVAIMNVKRAVAA